MAIEQDLAEVLKLAVYFQDDYNKKLPVIAAFRRWRNGAITTDEFLTRLREDDLAPVLHYEALPPTPGLALLNDHRAAPPALNSRSRRPRGDRWR